MVSFNWRWKADRFHRFFNVKFLKSFRAVKISGLRCLCLFVALVCDRNSYLENLCWLFIFRVILYLIQFLVDTDFLETSIQITALRSHHCLMGLFSYIVLTYSNLKDNISFVVCICRKFTSWKFSVRCLISMRKWSFMYNSTTIDSHGKKYILWDFHKNRHC